MIIASVIALLSAVLALKRFGKRHLYPFLLSLALEYFSYKNMSDSINSFGSRSRQGPTSEVERQELSKRRKAFWLYFLRGPLWYGWTREKLENFSNRFQGNRFGFGLIANILEDYKALIDEYHYCECVSSVMIPASAAIQHADYAIHRAHALQTPPHERLRLSASTSRESWPRYLFRSGLIVVLSVQWFVTPCCQCLPRLYTIHRNSPSAALRPIMTAARQLSLHYQLRK